MSIWNKNTREIWKKKFLISSLIKDRDFSTLFELSKNGYEFSDKQEKNIQKALNHSLIDRRYQNKLSIIKTLEKYHVPISNENYYHLMISNNFNLLLDAMEKEKINEDQKSMCEKFLIQLENIEFKKGLQEFIVQEIENRPQDFGGGIDWSMNRDVYYEPIQRPYLFQGMSKSQLSRIIKSGIGSDSVLNDYKVLLNQADIDNNIIKEFGLDTKGIVAKAQKDMLLNESALTEEMKNKINLISVEIEKIQKHDKETYQLEIEKISNELLPGIVKKYLSIDEEYRTSLRNVEGKLPSELLMESLNNIYLQVNYINQQINEEKITALSVDNRKLKKMKKM